jgi:hypothetical protein
MSSPGFFARPIAFYQGHIPFILADLLDQLKKADAVRSPDLFADQGQTDRVGLLADALDKARVKNWCPYQDVSTLSLTLVRYLNALTLTDPLISEGIVQAFCDSLSSPTLIKVIRRKFHLFDSGRHGSIHVLTDFLRRVESVPRKRLFRLFLPSLFGKAVVAGGRSSLKLLFELLLDQHEEIFKGSVIGEGSYLTDHQISRLTGEAPAGGMLRRRTASTRMLRPFTAEDMRPPDVAAAVLKSSSGPAGTRSVDIQCDRRQTEEQAIQCNRVSQDVEETQTGWLPLVVSPPTLFIDICTSDDEGNEEEQEREEEDPGRQVADGDNVLEPPPTRGKRDGKKRH